mmetsp:Transcript_13268/g.37853  ORF Transcript_13268/g.37853 Transcript_13268/m.37853 type:complete len:158 (-) Transcript_13268:264-737(-)
MVSESRQHCLKSPITQVHGSRILPPAPGSLDRCQMCPSCMYVLTQLLRSQHCPKKHRNGPRSCCLRVVRIVWGGPRKIDDSIHSALLTNHKIAESNTSDEHSGRCTDESSYDNSDASAEEGDHGDDEQQQQGVVQQSSRMDRTFFCPSIGPIYTDCV